MWLKFRRSLARWFSVVLVLFHVAEDLQLADLFPAHAALSRATDEMAEVEGQHDWPGNEGKQPGDHLVLQRAAGLARKPVSGCRTWLTRAVSFPPRCAARRHPAHR